MMSHSRMRSRWLSVAVAATLVLGLLALPAGADVVRMADGRMFEGKVMSEDNAGLTIDTVVGSIRTTLTFSKAAVAAVEKMALPANFFPAKLNPAGDKSAKAIPANTDVYMEIPIVGRIGDQIVFPGISKCLAYAQTNGIKHVVFMVDSQGGDTDTAFQISRCLASHEKNLTYHSVVRDATGLSIIFPLYSKTIALEPGATLGGVAIIYDPKKLGADTTDAIMRSRIARKAADIAKAHSLPPLVMVAMIDPNCRLAVWRDDKGAVKCGSFPPVSVPSSSIIFDNRLKPGILTLNRDDAIAAGFGAAYEGDAQGLGQLLKLPSWTSEGSYGADTIRATGEAAFQQKDLAAAKFEAEVQKVAARREEVASYIESNTKNANAWDPSNKESSAGTVYGDVDTKVITTGGQSNWFTDQANMTLDAVSRACKGIDEMKTLEAQAARLGLPAMYKPGQLDDMMTTLQTRAGQISAARDRQSKVVSY